MFEIRYSTSPQVLNFKLFEDPDTLIIQVATVRVPQAGACGVGNQIIGSLIGSSCLRSSCSVKPPKSTTTTTAVKLSIKKLDCLL